MIREPPLFPMYDNDRVDQSQYDRTSDQLKGNNHFSLFVAGILLPSPFLGEGLGVRAINHLCHYF